MKKNFYYAMISAALLTGAAGFSACSSDDVTEDTGLPGNAQEVKTEFAINIPRAGKAGRMTAENTQNDGKFLGMEGIHLIPVKLGDNETKVTDVTPFSKVIQLGDINDWQSEKTQTKIYNDVNVPVGTNRFLFYGHAKQGKGANATEPNEVLANFDNGVLSSSLTESSPTVAGNIKFQLVDAEGTDTKQADAVLKALNTVAAAKDWSTQEKNYLADLYEEFTGMKAGSAASVLLLMQDLYNAVYKDATAELQDDAAEDLKALSTVAKAIKGAIEESFSEVTESSTESSKELKWKTDNTYPRNINLPDGAAVVTFKDKFDWDYSGNLGDNTNNIRTSDICFPASLYYFCETPLKENSSSTATFPDFNGWGNGFDKGWGDTVTPMSKKIALKNPINYGVGVLELKVKCSTSTLPDNKKSDASQVGSQITVPKDGFPVTGVLIGGQPTSVGYNFEPVSKDSKNGFDKTIYDKSIAQTSEKNNIAAKYNANSTVYSEPNYTLVLSNLITGENAEQQAVNFAVELTNTSGADFRGADGIVPDGGTFYLIGQLTPKKPSEGGNMTGETDATSVFQSDYKTVANVTISTLAKAYNCIPDLRATNLELGLAVDLEWKAGMEFNVEIK